MPARAGSGGDWCFGNSEELLVRYAWYVVNSRIRTWPVGTLRPNDLGLFDVHGNVWQWCQDPVPPQPAVADAAAGFRVELSKSASPATMAKDGKWELVGRNTVLGLRGGSFDLPPWHLQLWAQTVKHAFPRFRHIDSGFRLAKTWN